MTEAHDPLPAPSRFVRPCQTPESFAAVHDVSARSVREWVKAGVLPGCTEPQILVCAVKIEDIQGNKRTIMGRRFSRRVQSMVDDLGPDAPWHWPWIVTKLLSYHGEAAFHRLLTDPFPHDVELLQKMAEDPEIRPMITDEHKGGIRRMLFGVDSEKRNEIVKFGGEAVDASTLDRWQRGTMRPGPDHRRRLLGMFMEFLSAQHLGHLPYKLFHEPRVTAQWLLWSYRRQRDAPRSS